MFISAASISRPESTFQDRCLLAEIRGCDMVYENLLVFSIFMREKKDLGDLGEKIAEKFLKDKGYKILDKNFRYSNFGELDIIASKDDNVVFCEVKTRKKTAPCEFLPEDNITRDKQRKLIKLAEIYLDKNNLEDKSWQINILAIEVYRNGTYDIRHTENAVGDMW